MRSWDTIIEAKDYASAHCVAAIAIVFPGNEVLFFELPLTTALCWDRKAMRDYLPEHVKDKLTVILDDIRSKKL